MSKSRPPIHRPAIYGRHSADSPSQGNGEWDFHGADTGEFLHGLHPYPAKFIPQIPRKAIAEWSSPGDVVLDPFCGCGTSLLEASLAGRPSIGADNNGVAIMVSQAKTARYSQKDLNQLKRFLAQLDGVLLQALPRPDLIPRNDNFMYWFNRPVALRLATIKGVIDNEAEPLRTALLAALSSIVVRVSFQDSDTRYARIERAVASADVDRAFKARVAYLADQLPALAKKKRAAASAHLADARNLDFISSESVDLIVTSPPYLNAYDYHKYHRQRLHLIDADIAMARNIEIGKHDDFTRPGATPVRYFTDMATCFAEWARVMKPGAKGVVIIGDAIVSKQPVPVGDTFVELLEQQGLPVKTRWVRTLQATRRSFNVRNSRISHEHVLLFENKTGRSKG